MNIIIIGSGRGVRKLDSEKSFPTVLQTINESQKTILDLILGTFKSEKNNNIYFIGGYHIEKVVKSYPELQFYYNVNWKKENFLDVFNIVELQNDQDTLIFDSNILFKKNFIDEIKLNNFHIGYKLFLEKNKKKLKIIYIKKKYIAKFKKFLSERTNLSQINFIKYINKNFSKTKVFNSDFFGIIEDQFNLSKVLLGTKADTLLNMEKILRKSHILDQYSFTLSMWNTKKENILKTISKKFKNKKLILRSSSIYEDREEVSNAGLFDSLLNVKNDKFIDHHINKVFENYKLKKYNSPKNQILVQEYLSNVNVSGVIFTIIQKDFSPYYFINYDDVSSKTDTVTSGNSSNIKSIFVYKFSKNLKKLKSWQKKIIAATKEIENKVNIENLDIEFAIDKKNKVYIFQIRPLKKIISKNYDINDFNLQLINIKSFIKNNQRKNIDLYGRSTIYSNMSDWNPAEMIGPTPLPLSFSLYRELITDSAWSKSRFQIGYKFNYIGDLIYSFCGLPYVDVRKSLNSFLLPDISHSLSEKLINSQLKYLKNNPQFNDKIEFKVSVNCYHFDRLNLLNHLMHNLSLNKREASIIIKKYKSWTFNLINNSSSLYKKLAYNYSKIENIDLLNINKNNNINDHLYKLKEAIRVTKEFGAETFGVSARLGFISLNILQSLMNLKIFSTNEYYEFLSNIPTVSSLFSRDLNKYFDKKISKQVFIKKYGHLRPSSYDLSSSSYETLIKKNFFSKKNSQSKNVIPSLIKAKKIWRNKRNLIDNLLKNEKVDFTNNQLLEFVIRGIQGREYGKFKYSRGLYFIIEILKKINKHKFFKGININFLSVDDLINLSSDSFINTQSLRSKANIGQKKFNITKGIKLSEIIFDQDDVDIIKSFVHQPNFINNKNIFGDVIYLDNKTKPKSIENKIIFIQSADPGYDWVFTSNIKGLVTMYGGMASHMAIRAAEYGLTAVIGCGEEIFNKFNNGQKILIDSKNKIIKKI